MKVKRYIRKDGRHMSGPQFKRKQWKDKMKSRSKSYGDKCFICNKEGHWSRNCPGKLLRYDVCLVLIKFTPMAA